MAKKKKQSKKKLSFGKKEYIFNIISLVIIICIGIYFGVRSFYYYGKQNMKIKEEEMTLNGLILAANKVTKEDNGLHQDTDGYYFKGNIVNNYVNFANRVFRVVRINNDNSIKLVSNDIVSEFIWGTEFSYKDSNLYQWLNVTDKEYSGVYYNTLPNVNKLLKKTSYSEDRLSDSKVKNSSEEYKDYVSTLTIKDYINANGKNSYLNINKYFWLLGLSTDDENLYVDSDGAVQTGISYEAYGVRAVITLKKNMKVTTGDGSVNSPYVIDQGSDTNFVDQYVKLGEDKFIVSSDSNNVLKLIGTNYVSINGSVYVDNYSSTNSLYNISNRYNIGYYLNRKYLNSLSYASILSDCNYYTGEISNETGLHYQDIYSSVVTAKVGLLNMFDYNSNTVLDDYYLLNTTSTVGSMAYIYHSSGLMEEVKVTEEKKFVPVVCIDKNLIKGGTGSETDPYIVG